MVTDVDSSQVGPYDQKGPCEKYATVRSCKIKFDAIRALISNLLMTLGQVIYDCLMTDMTPDATVR